MKRISILGSTGSIGTQTLDVVSKLPDMFQIEALSAGSNLSLLAQQIEKFRPKKVSVADKSDAEKLKQMVKAPVSILYGEEGSIEIAAATDADLVVTALVGSRGIAPTLAAINAGKHIALANKETLVSAGHIVTSLAAEKRVAILPVDSEHSAIFQCLNGENRQDVSRILITASGGSFRDRKREELEGVTVEEALKHPNWSMGAKVTIDSATMVNKGLEVIEAHWLFAMDYAQIDVLIHPQSIIHSLVEFKDSSVIAQLGLPDMRVPIQYALTYPNRFVSPADRLELAQLGKLEFREMDYQRFPCLKMAFDSGKSGGTSPTVFNAANEIAVERFLRREIEFLHIERIIEQVLSQHIPESNPDLEQILAADGWARRTAAMV